MMLKATLIDAPTARVLDETPCMVTEANAIVEVGKVTGVRVTLKLGRTLTVVKNNELVVTGHMFQFNATMPVMVAVSPAPPPTVSAKPQEPVKP
jgi:hypothetical protein